MKMLVGLLSLFLVVSAVADKKLAKEIEFLIERADPGNNGGNVELFEGKKRSAKSAARDFRKMAKEKSECGFYVAKNIDEVVKYLNNFESFKASPGAQELIQELVLTKKIEQAVGYYLMPQANPVESCFEEQLILYFDNGQALSVYYNSAR